MTILIEQTKNSERSGRKYANTVGLSLVQITNSSQTDLDAARLADHLAYDDDRFIGGLHRHNRSSL
jgi:hypothetical protein